MHKVRHPCVAVTSRWIGIACLIFAATSSAWGDEIVDSFRGRLEVLSAEGVTVEASVYTSHVTADLSKLSEAEAWDLAIASTSNAANPGNSTLAVKGDVFGSTYELLDPVSNMVRLSQIHYRDQDVFLYALSSIMKSPTGHSVRHQVDLSAAKMPIGTEAISEVQMGAMNSDTLEGTVSIVSTDGGAEVEFAGKPVVHRFRLDAMGRPHRLVVSFPSSPYGIIMQWRYDDEGKWPGECIVLSSRESNRVEVQRYDITEVKPPPEDIAKSLPIGKDVTLLDHRAPSVRPVALTESGSSVLTVADVLNAAGAERSGVESTRVIAQSSSRSTGIWTAIIAIGFGLAVVVFVVTRKKYNRGEQR